MVSVKLLQAGPSFALFFLPLISSKLLIFTDKNS